MNPRPSSRVGLLAAVTVLCCAGLAFFVARRLRPQGRPTPSCSHVLPTSSASVAPVTTNSVGLVLVRIPPGELIMGSTTQEQIWARKYGVTETWLARETPITRVLITYPFAIAATEITVHQYRQFCNSADYRSRGHRGNRPLVWDRQTQGWSKEADRTWENLTIPQSSNHPVVCLTWDDADAFCTWLTAKERTASLIQKDQRYRLPTEAEWQHACSGGTKTYFAWGDNVADAQHYANVVDSTPLPNGSVFKVPHMPWKDGYAFTAPVASFRPTALGLFDMHGNAWEWCDGYLYSYSGGVQTNSANAHKGSQRVLRGGSWDNYAGSFRSNARRSVSPNFSSDTTGFRIVLVAER